MVARSNPRSRKIAREAFRMRARVSSAFTVTALLAVRIPDSLCARRTIVITRAHPTVPHSRKNENVEHMHDAKDQQHHANLVTFQFDSLTQCRQRLGSLQRQTNVSDVDQVKADHQQVVYGVRELRVAAKRINQKDSAITMQRSRNPDG